MTPGEEYNLGDAYNTPDGLTNNSPYSITVPSDAALGHTTMRVSTKYKGNEPEPCETDFDGEVEDYTLNVQYSLSVINNFDFDDFTVYPNPNQGEFTIKLNSAPPNYLEVEIFDIRGRIIYQNSYQTIDDFKTTVKLTNTQSSLYLLRINDGSKQATKKIIIK